MQLVDVFQIQFRMECIARTTLCESEWESCNSQIIRATCGGIFLLLFAAQTFFETKNC